MANTNEPVDPEITIPPTQPTIPTIADLFADRVPEVRVHIREMPIPPSLSAGDYQNDAAFHETSFGNTGVIGSTIYPAAFPRSLARILKVALKRAPEANYHLGALPRFGHRLAKPTFALRPPPRSPDGSGEEPEGRPSEDRRSRRGFRRS